MIFRLVIVFLSLIASGFSHPHLFNELNIQRSPETVEKFEMFLEKNPSLAKTMRYGVEGINGVLMASGVKGLLTSGLPKALVALGFGEALSTASSWAGGKVEGMVAEVATSESEAQRFMKALKTCAGTAGVVVGVKIATKSLKASKIQPPTIKDALSERPIIKDGKVWLGETELGSAPQKIRMTREKRWLELASENNSRLPKEVINTVKRHSGKKIEQIHGLQLAHKPGKPACRGHDYRESVPKTIADHLGIEHRHCVESKMETVVLTQARPKNVYTKPNSSVFERLQAIEDAIKEGK